MKIELWSDFACPFCYIGKKRFEQALEQFAHKDQVEITYMAYQLDPRAPKENPGDAAENFAKSHGMSKEKAQERLMMFTKAAEEEGLKYRYDIVQMTNTLDAHRLAKWANKFGLEAQFIDRLMKAYFTDGLNIADHETLVFLAKGLGLDSEIAAAILKGSQYSNQVLQQKAAARQVGVEGVPFFVINRKYAISGAQSVAYFLQALNQIYNEEQEQPLEKMAEGTEYCDDDSCHIE